MGGGEEEVERQEGFLEKEREGQGTPPSSTFIATFALTVVSTFSTAELSPANLSPTNPFTDPPTHPFNRSPIHPPQMLAPATLTAMAALSGKDMRAEKAKATELRVFPGGLTISRSVGDRDVKVSPGREPVQP